MTSPLAPDSRTTARLFEDYAAILAELRRRQVVRSANAPVGDYAEWIVARALKGELVSNFSVKSYDLTLPTQDRVQVKSRLVSSPTLKGQLQTSPFRSWDFELAAFVILDSATYQVRRAVLVPVSVVQEQARWRKHVNGSVVFMNNLLLDHAESRDFSDEARVAALTA